MAGGRDAGRIAGALGVVWTRAASGVDARGGALPLTHRLTLIYLAVPLAIWLAGWFKWWFGVPAAGLLALGLWPALAGAWRPRPSLATVCLGVFMLLWVLAFPAGGVFRPLGMDWAAHRGVFLDLGRGGWPTYVTDFGDGAPMLLRYYLGYFMVPGLVGKWLGPSALNWAVPLWTWLGMTLLAVLFARGLPTVRAKLLAVAIGLVLFSGLDVLEYMLREGPLDGLARIGERARRGIGPVFEMSWQSPMFLEYQANALTFRNSPQHFLAGGLGALLILELRRNPRFLAIVAVLLLACAFWSALVALGLLPLAACLTLGGRWRRWLSWSNVAVAPLLGATLALYYYSGRLDFASGWLWEIYPSALRAVADMVIFYVCEFLLLTAFVWWLRADSRRDVLFHVAVGVLLIAPWYWYGDPDFSELTLRLVVPALFVLAWHAARTVAERSGNAAGRRASTATGFQRAGFVFFVCCLGVGALSALVEFATVLRKPDWLAYQRAHLTSALVRDVEQRAAKVVPKPLRALLRDMVGTEPTALRSDAKVLTGEYDIYLQDRMLVLVKTDCDLDFERTARFMLRRYPRGGAASARRDSDQWRAAGVRSRHDACVHWRHLPRDGWRRFGIAQVVPGEGVVWEAEIALDNGSVSSRFRKRGVDFFRARRAALVADARASLKRRAEFDVYDAGDRLVLLKTPCDAADTIPKFFLHVYAQRRQLLPPRRQRHGFDNLDFGFGERGARVDGSCATAAPLPEYPIARIALGQWRPAQAGNDEELWRIEFTPAAARAPPVDAGPAGRGPGERRAARSGAP